MESEADWHHHLYEAIRVVRPIHLNVHRFVEHLLSGHDLTVAKRAVLEATIELEAATTAELSRHLSLKRQHVERIVGPLTDDGLIRRDPSPVDRRAQLWSPTKTGREVFATIHRAEVAAVAEMCGDIDPADITTAAKVMAAIDERLRVAVHALDTQEVVR